MGGSTVYGSKSKRLWVVWFFFGLRTLPLDLGTFLAQAQKNLEFRGFFSCNRIGNPVVSSEKTRFSPALAVPGLCQVWEKLSWPDMTRFVDLPTGYEVGYPDLSPLTQLGILCSIHLSYGGASVLCRLFWIRLQGSVSCWLFSHSEELYELSDQMISPL